MKAKRLQRCPSCGNFHHAFPSLSGGITLTPLDVDGDYTRGREESQEKMYNIDMATSSVFRPALDKPVPKRTIRAAEKYLEAYLQEKGIEFPRQHDLIRNWG